MARIVPGFAAARERGRVKFAWARGLRPFRATSSAKPVGRIGRTGIDVPDGVTAPVGAYDVPAGRLETDQPRPIRLEPGLGRRREAGVGRAGRNAGRERCKERRSCCCRDQPQWPSHRPLPYASVHARTTQASGGGSGRRYGFAPTPASVPPRGSARRRP